MAVSVADTGGVFLGSVDARLEELQAIGLSWAVLDPGVGQVAMVSDEAWA